MKSSTVVMWKEPHTFTDTQFNGFPTPLLHHHIKGAEIQKVGHSFLDALPSLSLQIANITLPWKQQPFLCTSHDERASDQVKADKKEGEKVPQLHSRITRDMLCLPEWVYLSILAWNKNNRPNKAGWKVVLHSWLAAFSSTFLLKCVINACRVCFCIGLFICSPASCISFFPLSSRVVWIIELICIFLKEVKKARGNGRVWKNTRPQVLSHQPS